MRSQLVSMSIKSALLYLIAALFILMPIASFLFKGPFRWHVMQPEAWQGALELLVLFLLLYFTFFIKSKPVKYLAFLLSLEIYARRHGVDFSIVMLFLYIQGIFSLGWIVLTWSNVTLSKNEDKLYVGFFSGVCIWSLILWIASLVGFGAVEVIRLITICVLGVAIFISRSPLLTNVLATWLFVKKTTERICVVIASVVFVGLFAKISSANTINYDSMWYGLQLEKSMVGEGSIFTNQGLVAVVHYYPKLYELLLLPFAGLGSMSLLMGLSVFFLLALIITCYSVLRQFRVNKTLSMLIVVMITTVPALGSVAMTTKGDVFAAWLGMVAVLSFLRFYNTKLDVYFYMSVSALLLAPLARLSVIPYVTLVLVFLIYYLFTFRAQAECKKTQSWIVYVLPLTAFIVALFVLGRSIAVSGVPFVAPPQLVKMAGLFGLTVEYPVGGSPESVSSAMPIIWTVWSYLFNPANIGIMLITWIGNSWLFILVLALFVSKVRKKMLVGIESMLLYIGLLFPLVIFLSNVPPSRGVDGNYFIYPIACIYILSGLHINAKFNVSKKLLSGLFLAFSISSSLITYVTADWGPGTRSYDFVYDRVPFELASKEKFIFQDKDNADLLKYFKTRKANSRVIGLNIPVGNGVGWLLPVRFEPLEIIHWSRPEITKNDTEFEKYLKFAQIDHFIVPGGYIDQCADGLVCSIIKKAVNEVKAEKVLENKKYQVFKFIKNPLRFTMQIEGEGEATLGLAPGSTCETLQNLKVKVMWSFPKAIYGVRIEVKAKSQLKSSIWVEGSSTGVGTTGPWMAPGSSLMIIDKNTGNILANAVINSCENQDN
jgi:hypothetical protein